MANGTKVDVICFMTFFVFFELEALIFYILILKLRASRQFFMFFELKTWAQFVLIFFKY